MLHAFARSGNRLVYLEFMERPRDGIRSEAGPTVAESSVRIPKPYMGASINKEANHPGCPL